MEEKYTTSRETKRLLGFIAVLLPVIALMSYAGTHAAIPNSTVINEVAWMGTQADANDEWVELFNTTDQAIDLANWKLVAADGSPNIALSGTIPAHGFFLLERTDDTTINDIPADKIYTGSLSNSGEALFLRDPAGTVIDSANSDGGSWPAGNSTTRSTMERIDPLAPDSDANWATHDGIHRNGLDANGNPVNGTPKTQNSASPSNSNRDPIANAGADQATDVDSLVMLDGAGSSDPDGDPLSFLWVFVKTPLGSTATLNDANTAHPTFIADIAGEYLLQLTVINGKGGTGNDQVTIRTSRAVVVNEIAWMGTQSDPDGEWMELQNNTAQDIDLTNWTLRAADGVPAVVLSGTIPARGFFLLERSNDNPISDIAADQIYTGILSNSGEILTLKDPSGNLLDSANANGGSWPAGANPSGNPAGRASMERIDPLGPDTDENWVTNKGIIRNGLDVHGLPINGTPKAQNSTVNLPPTANAGSDQVTNEGSVVTLDGSASSDPNGNSLTCIWDPGDGSGTLSGCVVSHSYADNGLFTTRLTVDDGHGGISSDTAQITINNFPPTVDAGLDQTASVSQLIQFSGSFTDPGAADTHTILWDFGDGNSASGALNPAHSYSALGQYTTTLTITDDDGGVGIDTLTVSVNGPTLGASKRAIDPTGAPLLAGEELAYEIEITNTSTAAQPDNPDPEFEDLIPDGTHFIENSLTASSGSAVFDSANNRVVWNGTVTPAEKITIRFRVEVSETVATGQEILNQGRVFFDADGNGSNETTRLTDDPDTPEPNDPTRRTVLRKGDANGDGVIDLQDAILCAEIALELKAPTAVEEAACDVAAPYGIIDGRDVVRIADTSLKSAALSSPYASRKSEKAYELVNNGAGYRFLIQGRGITGITVSIYDLGGRKIFASDPVNSNFVWHAQDQDGKRLANGVYLYRVTVYGFQGTIAQSDVRRLVIIH